MATVKIEKFPEDETERLKKVYPTPFIQFGQRYIRTIPGNCVLPAAFEKFKDRFKTWNTRADDVYVLTFPKNGTTWTQELVWCIQNDCDFDKAKNVMAIDRVPFLEVPVLTDCIKDVVPFFSEDLLARADEMDSPRVLKSHLQFCLFPDDLLEKSKAVICLRNPKDTVVSFYNHEKLIKTHDYDGDFENYFDLFMDNLLIYTPYFDYIVEAWKRRDHPNVCLLLFEDMKADLASCVRKVAEFLGKVVSDDRVTSLVDHLSFKKMKENESVNMKIFQDGKILKKEGSFFRKGEVGDWKNYFTDEMNKRMDEAIEKYLKPIGLEFRYE